MPPGLKAKPAQLTSHTHYPHLPPNKLNARPDPGAGYEPDKTRATSLPI